MSDDAQIRSLVEQLDSTIPRDGRVVVLADPDEGGNTLVRASKLGYLRLGIEIMKAAYLPSKRDRTREMIDLDLGYLTGLDEHCYSFERSEEVEKPVPADPSGFWGNAVGFTVVGLILASLVVGVVTILRWLGSLVF